MTMTQRGASVSKRGDGGASAELKRLRSEYAALRGRIARFVRVADQSAALIYLRDLTSGDFIYVNDRFEELLGYPRAEMTAPGFDLFAMVAADSLERVRSSVEMHLRGEDHLPFEFALVGRDGRRVEVILNSWVTEWDGRRAVFGIMTDITPHHRLAEQLRQALARAEGERARAESVIAALGQSIIVQDRDYRITYQNDINRRLFGDRTGELCYRVHEGLDHVCPECPVERTFRDGKVHRSVTTVRHGGRTLHAELTASPLLDPSGNVVAGLKLVRDITDQVEAAEALRRAKEDLERQNVELRALDRLKDGLLRDVSHELKTPVAKQAMQVEILRVQLGDACRGPVARTLGVIEEGIHRQQRVIRNLLDLARLESGRRLFCLGPVRADEVLTRVLEDYQPTLASAGFAVEVRAEPVTATADEEMLWHVLSNLVNNAVKFARREGPRRLEASVSIEGDRGVVRIADNGIGMSPEEQARAFDRFYQASASIEGSGVGLSICRAIMEGMGGSVRLDSSGRGEGAVATVTLPR
jgi:PAS domain S-box-containing protein